MKINTLNAFTVLLIIIGVTACKDEYSPAPKLQTTTMIIHQRHIKMAYDNPNYFNTHVAPTLQPPEPYADHPYIEARTQQRTLLQPPLGLQGVFTLTVREKLQDYTQVELQFNNRLLYSSELNEASFGGYCQMPNTNALVFFIDSVNEGIGTYQHEIILQDETHHWVTQELPGQDSPTIFENYAQCETSNITNANAASENNGLALCHCNLSEHDFSTPQAEQWQAAIGNTERALFELPARFQQGQSIPLVLYPIADQTALQTLIDNAQKDENFEVSRIELDIGSVLIATQENETYFNIGYGFLGTQGQWHLWYTAGDSSKSFQPITELVQKNTHTVTLELCINDCGWWGKRAEVELDVKALTLKKLASEDDHN